MKKLIIQFKDGEKTYWLSNEYNKWIFNPLTNRFCIYDENGRMIAVYRTNSVESVEERQVE